MSRVTPSPPASVTWFIDPPYNNAAGKKYATSSVNYTHLAAWCQSRHGQTVVCENAGADWLPFTTLTATRRGIHYGTADEKTAGEVVWTQETEPIGLWTIHEPVTHAAAQPMQPAEPPSLQPAEPSCSSSADAR
jgi:hypothetical protein